MRHPSSLLLVLATLLLVQTSSCKLISSAANAPGKVASGLMGGKKDAEKVPPNILQGSVMRFADTFAARITQATHEFAEKAGTPEAHIQALTWEIGQNTAAFTGASGPNANLALLDMVVLITLGRRVHEEYWLPKVWGEADRPMLDAFVSLEEDIWSIASKLYTEEQQQKIHAALDVWREENPDMGVTAFVRLPTFQDIVKRGDASGKDTSSSLGDLLSVDPLSGLEPAVREIEKTRIFGERTVYYLQRAPLLLSAQMELLGLKLTRMPEVHSTVEAGDRISLAAKSIAETAAELPESVRAEREAAVKQISGELTAQRQGIVDDLAKAQEPAGRILTDARATLEAGTKMSAALQGTIATLDAFLAGFKTPASPEGAPPPPPEEPGKPFDIAEYGVAAQRVEGAARELNGLVATLDQSLPEVRRMVDEAVQGGGRVVDHAFVRGLELGVLLIAVAALAVFAVRWMLARVLAPKASQASA